MVIAIPTVEDRTAELDVGLRSVCGELTADEVVLVRAAASDAWAEPATNARLMLRAEVLKWLVETSDAVSLFPRRRLRIRGCEVDGPLDLGGVRTRCGLEVIESLVGGSLDMTDASLGWVVIAGSTIGDGAGGDVCADAASFDGALSLPRLRARTLWLRDGHLGGSLLLTGATLKNSEGLALAADRVTISGGVFLNHGAEFLGDVRLHGATVGGPLSCSGASFTATQEQALGVDWAEIADGVFLEDASFAGEVTMPGVSIQGPLSCGGSTFDSSTGVVLNAENARVTGNVSLHAQARFGGEVTLLAAQIGGQLSCEGSSFAASEERALTADGAVIRGHVLLRRNAVFKGEVRLVGATLDSQLSCVGSSFEGVGDEAALTAEGARIRGDVFLDDATFDGGVKLPGAMVDGAVFCLGATLRQKTPAGAALNMENAQVKGTTLLVGRLDGHLALSGLHIQSRLTIAPASPAGADLREAQCDILNLVTVPTVPISLEGAVYNRLESSNAELGSVVDALLNEFASRPVSARTYEHLATALQNSGEAGLAREVVSTRYDHLRRSAPWHRRAPLWLFKVTMNYGYSPARLFGVALGIAMVGAAVFWLGIHREVIEPPANVNDFVAAIAIGFGALLPLSTIEPHASSPHDPSTWMTLLHNVVWGWYWFENVAGWFLAAIGIAGLANVVRRV